jgi:hypothetical protein
MHRIGHAVISRLHSHQSFPFGPTQPRTKCRQHRELSNISPDKDGAGNIHQPDQQRLQSYALVSMPNIQNLQQQYQQPANTSTNKDIPSTPYQHTPPPKSDVASLCNHDSPSSVFLAPSKDLIIASYHNKFSINPLAVLLYSLRCSQIRQDILFRGLLPQKRWDDCGNVHEIMPCDAGFIEQITSLFSSQRELEQTMASCIQLGLVVQGVLEDGSLVYSVSEHSQHQISQSFKLEELHLLGLMFIVHIYPRDQALEPT